MFTRIIIHSVVLFVLLGCGFMFDDEKKGSDNSKVSDEIKSFAVGVTNNDKKLIMKSMNTSKDEDKEKSSHKKIMTYQKENIESCENGGTIKFIIDEDMKNDIFEVKIVANDCIVDGIKTNYSYSMEIEKKDDNLEITTLTFTENSTFEDLETTVVTTLFKDSIIIMDELSINEELATESLKLSSSTGKKYESIKLVSHDKYEDNNDSSYNISGQIVNNGIVYSVDETYESSKTPMVYVYEGNKEFLVSGISKYYNEKHQHITIEVVKRDTIKISVDIDNDGKDEAVEVVEIKNFNP